MFLIDRDNKTTTAVPSPTFAEKNFHERYDLQEWIAKNPKMLGEELLIIQKEFDKFKDASMRLDLLALDKKGNLVVIENKLDDSGTDVVGQALNYVSHFSTVSQQKVVQIFQDYLDTNFPEQEKEAEKELCEFFGTDDISKIPVLNQADRNEGRYQRIILVAREFRSVVTSTVMWLRQHKVEIKCVKTALYEHDGKIFIDTEQIIPPVKDVVDYQGELAAKRRQDKSATADTNALRGKWTFRGLNIPEGEKLTYVSDEKIECTVVDGEQSVQHGETIFPALVDFAKLLLGVDKLPPKVYAPMLFKYGHNTIAELRKKQECKQDGE